jgi:drug/metabolite transporter (DMT)-like permease
MKCSCFNQRFFNYQIRTLKYLPQVLFWLLGIIWGSSFIYMKMGSDFISPLQIVLVRVICGFIPVAIFAYFNKALKLSHLKHIGHIFVLSLIGTIAYYYGFVKGASLLQSGIVGALSGLTPIFSYLLALILLSEEKASGQKILGVVAGFVGVVLIARPFGADITMANIEGVLYTLVGSFSIGASFVYVKKYVIPLEIPASALITYQLGIGMIILFLVTDLKNIGNIWNDAYVAAGLIIGLGVFGTGIAYIIYYYIIEKLGAVAASSVAYIPPIVALVIGVIIVGEDIVAREYVGAALILAGVILINRVRPHNKPMLLN